MLPGDVYSKKRAFSQEDFDAFAWLSGDDNPIHVDPAFASRTRFGHTVAHGMLLYSVLCGLMAEHFPAMVQVEQELMFPNPTLAGEEVTFLVGVTESDRSGDALVAMRVLKADGSLGLDGTARLRPVTSRGGAA